MNKRRFKKYIQYFVSDSIDRELMRGDKPLQEDIELQKRIDALLDLYDSIFNKIHENKLLPDAKARKKHFKDLLADLELQVQKIISSK